MAALCRIRTPEAYKQANVESLPTCAGTVNYFKIIYTYKKESMHSIPPTLPNQINSTWIFQKENGNTFTLLIIFIVKSLQKVQKSTNLLL